MITLKKGKEVKEMANCKIKGCNNSVGININTGKPFDFCQVHYNEFILGKKTTPTKSTKVKTTKLVKQTPPTTKKKLIKQIPATVVKPSALKEAQKFIKDSSKVKVKIAKPIPVKKVVKKPIPVKKIDTREYYSILKDLIDKRYSMEEQHRINWSNIHKGYSIGDEQRRLSKRIGDVNHQINLVIEELIKYGFKQSSAMRLAYDFSTKEYERVKQLIVA